ncbi:Magnesium transporters: CorA family [Klebsormidium nitens]|uniref:Magnesium transporter n=1 Tax=Klebsormidium nitens TaxID=105231 RepID=A0A0U9HJT8_KLENI|nr:Magnesium transporters: CorA family [Klebsormidium nitens]|eukprot:GAQ83259.1 Magnesium transporters: CorA family [Klebsormidium nitens]
MLLSMENRATFSTESETEAEIRKEALRPFAQNRQHSEKGSLEGPAPKYKVWKVTRDGRKTEEEIPQEALGLPPRDLDILSSVTFTPHRAQIGARGGKMLVRMENLRALIAPEEVIFFGGRFARSAATCAELAASFLAQHPQGGSQFPFELRMLECILRETRTYFVHKIAKLKMVAEAMLEDLASDISTAGLHLRLLPLKRTMTEVDNDVRETYEALTEVIENDTLLMDLCRTVDEGSEGAERAGNEAGGSGRKRAVVAMLLSYQREVQDVGSALKELRENMDSAQAVWELGLDSTRNRIIKMNLYIGMATLSASCAQLPAAFFGMNVPSGLEEAGGLFPYITGAACAASLGLFGYCLYWYKFRPQRKHQRRLQDIAALRDLLHHIDDLDDIIKKGMGKRPHVNEQEFTEILRNHPATAQLNKGSVALIFRMLDQNKNHCIDVEEFGRALDSPTTYKNSQQIQ